MITREYVKTQIDTLPENALEKLAEFIAFQRFTLGLFDNDTDYLMSIPGMVESIKLGMNEPLSESVDEVWDDV